MGRLDGKIALVTGAASGLGAAITDRFVREGALVVAADIDAPALARLATAPANTIGTATLDVTLPDDWTRVLQRIAQDHGHIDILVNNAGIAHLGTIESLPLEAFRRMLDVDLVGVFLGCKLVIPLMKENGGSVINMSSMSGLRAQAELAGYNAAKAGVTLLTKSVALHYARQGYRMRCNSLHPGAIRTPILEKVLADAEDPDALLAGWVATHPIGRIGEPEDVAGLAVYLASDESSFATGGCFSIDGGATL